MAYSEVKEDKYLTCCLRIIMDFFAWQHLSQHQVPEFAHSVSVSYIHFPDPFWFEHSKQS